MRYVFLSLAAVAFVGMPTTTSAPELDAPCPTCIEDDVQDEGSNCWSYCDPEEECKRHYFESLYGVYHSWTGPHEEFRCQTCLDWHEQRICSAEDEELPDLIATALSAGHPVLPLIASRELKVRYDPVSEVLYVRTCDTTAAIAVAAAQLFGSNSVSVAE